MVDFSDAQRFIAKVVPFTPGAYVNLHYFTTSKKPGGLYYMQGVPVQSVTEFVKQVKRCVDNPSGARDIYFCTSSQSEVGTKQGARGSFNIAVRKMENAVEQKSFRLDLDVGEKKGYQTRKDALAALANLIKLTSLPKPNVVVSSGSGGFHIYWIVAEPIPITEWQPYADALVEAALESGMVFDSGCTTDAVRILRVPETLNYKSNPPKPVTLDLFSEVDYLKDKIFACLEPWLGRAPRVTAKGKTLAPDENDELRAGLEREYAPADINRLAESCAWIKYSIDTGGVDNENLLRRFAFAIALRCMEPKDAAWALMRLRETVTDEEFLDQYGRAQADFVKKELPIPYCTSIDRERKGACKDCPHLEKGKNPLAFAVGTQLVPAAACSLAPFLVGTEYHVGADEKVYRSTTDEDGAILNELIFPYPIRDPWMAKDQGGGFIWNFNTTIMDGSHLDAAIKCEDVCAIDASRKALSKRSMFIPHMTQATQDFLMTFLQNLRNSPGSVIPASPFGWAENDDKIIQGFTFGGKTWARGAITPAAAPMNALASKYKPAGDTEQWRQAAKLMIEQGRPELDCIIASAFAAPLVRFTGHKGMTIGAWSLESGVGKSTALEIAQAVWGSPTAISGLTDTTVSTGMKLGQLKNLPVYWDELKSQEQTKHFVNMMFQVSSGNDRNRGRRDGTLAETKEWQTLLFYASNEALYDAILQHTKTTTAGHMRVFEYEVRPTEQPNIHTAGMVTRLVGTLRQNHGGIGLEYAKYLGENYEKVALDVAKISDALEKALHAENDERYWICAIAVLLVGASLSNKLGFTAFDIKGMRDFLAMELKRMQAKKREAPNDMAKGENVIAALGAFLNEMGVEHSLTTNIIWTNAGRPQQGHVKVIGDGTQHVSRLKVVNVQKGRDDHQVRIRCSALTEWLKKNEYPYTGFTTSLGRHFGAKKGRWFLASGTTFGGDKEYLWHINTKGTALESAITWE
jgi:hypothetical protein